MSSEAKGMLRDRLPDLLELAHNNPDRYNEPEAHQEVPLSPKLKVMFGRAGKVTKYLSEMKVMMLQLNFLQERVLTSASLKEEEENREQMNSLGNRFSALARKCKAVLKRFEIPENEIQKYSAAGSFRTRPNRDDIEMMDWTVESHISWHRLGSGVLLPLSGDIFIPAEIRMSFHLHNILSYKLTGLVRDYYTMQKVYGDKCKEKIKRQMSIIGRQMDEEEIDEAIHRQEQIPLLHKEITDDTAVDRQMQARIREVEVLHKEILDLEKSIEELHQSFLTISQLVHDQGAIVDRIEHHISIAADYVEESTEVLKKASGYQQKYRKKKLIFAILIVVLIAVIIIIIVVTVKKRHHSPTKVIVRPKNEYVVWEKDDHKQFRGDLEFT